MGGFYAVLPYLSKLTDFENSLKPGEEVRNVNVRSYPLSC